MQKNLRLIARLTVARHECTYVRHCKENSPIYMYYVAPETPMMLSVIADCPELAPPNILDKSTPMVGWKVIWKLPVPDFKPSPPLTISTHIKFFKFMKYTVLKIYEIIIRLSIHKYSSE